MKETFNIERALAKLGKPLSEICAPLHPTRNCVDCQVEFTIRTTPHKVRCVECQTARMRRLNKLKESKRRARIRAARLVNSVANLTTIK